MTLIPTPITLEIETIPLLKNATHIVDRLYKTWCHCSRCHSKPGTHKPPDSLREIFAVTSLLLYDTTCPALNHVILGTGLPVALQSSVTLSPSLTGVEHCWIVTVGGSGREI